jgi:hypothetical protein
MGGAIDQLSWPLGRCLMPGRIEKVLRGRDLDLTATPVGPRRSPWWWPEAVAMTSLPSHDGIFHR